MTRAIVDASVIVKTLVDQPQTERARSVIRAYDLAAPVLLLAEVSNALLRYVRAGVTPPEVAVEALNQLNGRGIILHPIDEAFTREAFDAALTLSHSIYDCYYLALASRLRAPFITADLKLARKAAGAGVSVIDLADIPEGAP